MTSLRKSCMFQKTKVWACCLHFWYFVAFGISCTLCKHQKSSRSFWNDTMSSITIYLFRVMFYIRRFKRCSEAICVQDPNVGMLKSDDDLFLDSSLQWPCNYVQVLVKFVSPSAPANTYSWSHGQVTCTGNISLEDRAPMLSWISLLQQHSVVIILWVFTVQWTSSCRYFTRTQ